MTFPGSQYAPPGPYTQTDFQNPIEGNLASLKVPIFIGEGQEILTQNNYEVVRGSSSVLDTLVTREDLTGRAVASISQAGAVTLGDSDGVRVQFQVRNFPIVDGSGAGLTTNDRSNVTVFVNNTPVFIKAVTGATGIIELTQAPLADDEVRVTYNFNRTDTLFTDNVSEQVTPTAATVRATAGISDVDAPNAGVAVLNFHGDVLNGQGAVVVPANNVLLVTVDGVTRTVTLSPRPDYTMTQVAAAISSAGAGSLVATRFTNNFGQSALLLTADQDLSIGSGSANGLLSLTPGDASTRRRTFYTSMGPIVDGSNGGITTTDPAHVMVKINGVQVIPTRVDGASRAVTLATSPKIGAQVTIRYYANTWQDTFDYLGHINVQAVSRCGEVPDSATFIQGADFILKDDRIHWGTSVLVSSGVHTTGSEFFGEAQIATTLIDNKTYLSPCTAVLSTSRGVPQASVRDFQLPMGPTLGNGRDTKLGASLFQSASNNRMDLPVNRPDVIDAYWGFSVQDALDRGAQPLVRVEGSVITFASDVPPGATVYATFYHNRLTDNEFTLTCAQEGPSGTGAYSILDQGDVPVIGAVFNIGSKGSALNGVSINWPSGSELSSDIHYEGGSGDDFIGPLTETVSVQFEAREATPAKWSVPGPGPYAFILDESDKANVYVNGAVLNNNGGGEAGLSLADPSGHGGGFFASLVGDEIAYTGGTGATAGQTYSLATAEELNLEVDGVSMVLTIPPENGVTNAHLVDYINENVAGHQSTAVTGAASTITLNAGVRSDVDDFYKGWIVVVNDGLAAGEFLEVLSYVGATGVATLVSAWVGGAPAVGDAYYIYNPANLNTLKGATRFDGPVTLAAGAYDKLAFSYTGTTASAATLTADLGDGPFATAALLAAEVAAQMNAAIAAVIGANPDLAGFQVNCVADSEGRLTFSIQLAGTDSAGYLSFLNGASTAVDFAILAGLDTDTNAAGAQAKLLQGPVARRYTPITGATTLLHDRVILRDRIHPGGVSMHPASFEAQMGLVVRAGSGNTKAGLANGMFGEGGSAGVVSPASMVGFAGFAGGQSAAFGDARDLQPTVTFFDGTGANPANNVLGFVIDQVPVTVTFTASASGVLTALGPITVAGSVLEQILQALAALPGTPFGNEANIRDTLKMVRQEGSGIRLTSTLSSVSSQVLMGSGSATGLLGFSAGAVAQRNLVSARKAASALNANRHTTEATYFHTFSSSTANFFSTDALAWVMQDAAAREFLYLQSNTLGIASALQWRTATVASIQTDDVLFPGTGLFVTALTGASGEAALDGFFVTSNQPNGSGSINDSLLNNLVGQDGVVGQTYRDAVTGLTFTILPRGFQDNEAGPWLSYPTGANATFRIDASSVFVTNANIPHNGVNGVELLVANTLGVPVGDTAIVETFERGGEEPAIGDFFYVSYTFTKESFATSFFTKLSAIEAAYGPVSPDNPLSLAASLAISNGAVLVGLKQVPREAGQSQASLTEYRNAIDELEGVLPGNISPDMVNPLRGDSTDLFAYLKRSNDKMSSIRYKSERTSILGSVGGTTPAVVGQWAALLSNTRMRLIYPDIFQIKITDAFNTTKTHLIDGPFAAAALAGSVVSPALDVATPWTHRNLVGITQVARKLNEVDKNQLAVKGLTILEDRTPFIRVRHGLTTDMSSILTRLPTIILIADEVQRASRNVLDKYIGMKFLPTVLNQVEGNLSMMLKAMVAAQILSAYAGVRAVAAQDDPTVGEVQAHYAPVFPLLYLLLQFHLRSSLN